MPTPETHAPQWTIIVPVKQTMHAKTRLTGFDPGTRRDLAMSFALDTVSAILACPRVDRVVVVSSDAGAAAFEKIGAVVVPDQPDAGLNPALVYAAQQIRKAAPHGPLAALSSDLPALRGEDLVRVIDAATTPGWFVADAHGVGTTMLATQSRDEWHPRFGAHSRAAHRQAGLTEIDLVGLERLRRDVDTPVDLWDAVRLGLGPNTRRVLADAGYAH